MSVYAMRQDPRDEYARLITLADTLALRLRQPSARKRHAAYAVRLVQIEAQIEQLRPICIASARAVRHRAQG